MYKRVLVPVDGSEVANRALDEAVSLIKGQPAELKVVFIGSDEESSHEIIEAAVAKAGNSGVRAEGGLLGKLETEEVAEVILQEAREWAADLVVMGTHGRRGMAHMFLGSVAEGVIRASPIPVLVIRGP